MNGSGVEAGEGQAGGSRDAGPPGLAECEPELRRYVRLLAGPTPWVEDIVQETMVRALTSFHRYDPERPFRAWLQGIAFKVTHKYWRRIRRTRSFEQRAEASLDRPSTGPSPDEGLVRRERAAMLYRALDRLPVEQSEALLLHLGERLPAEEVARITGTTVTNVYTRVSRARTRLRALLEQQRRADGSEEDVP